MRNYAHVMMLAIIVLLLTAAERRDSALVEAGYAMLWSGDPSGPDAASAIFSGALRRDPASPYRWSDLGADLAARDRGKEARYCYLRAIELGQKVCPILLRGANFFFESGDLGHALTLFSSVLQAAPDYDSEIFGYYRRLDLPVEEILRRGIPAEARAAQSWVRWLMVAGDVTALRTVWTWTVERGFADNVLAVQYVTWLLEQHDIDEAASVWHAYTRNGDHDYWRSNFVFNGGFESAPTGSPFDWTLQPSSEVEIVRDSRMPWSGAWSLRTRFRGGTGTWNGVSQMAFVAPGAYWFRARIRTEDLPVDSAVQFRIFDAENGERLNASAAPASAPLSSQAPWTAVEKKIQVSAPTRLLRIQVEVTNSGSGTAWVDGVELTPANSQ